MVDEREIEWPAPRPDPPEEPAEPWARDQEEVNGEPDPEEHPQP